MAPRAIAVAPGVDYFPRLLDRAEQEALRDEIRAILTEAPLFRARMPRTGKPFSVRMSNCGPLGWVSDEAGYRYQPTHPETGRAWPPIPPRLLDVWAMLAPGAPPPEACLINFYDANAKMGLHQDRDEEELSAPVLSLSLGDAALFRLGGLERNDPTRSFRLEIGRRRDLRGAGEARLPRRRPHHRRRIDPAGSGRPDQSDLAAGDAGKRLIPTLDDRSRSMRRGEREGRQIRRAQRVTRGENGPWRPEGTARA